MEKTHYRDAVPAASNIFFTKRENRVPFFSLY